MRRERPLRVGDRHVDRHRPVAGEHAGLQELARCRIGGELTVAELIAFPHPQLEERRQVVDIHDRHPALDLLPPRQPQGNGRDRAEHAVAAHRVRKQAGIGGPAAVVQHSVRVDDRERLDIRHERLQPKAAAVDVGGERTADRQAVGASLLLDDAPRLRGIRERPEQVIGQPHPVDAGADGRQAAFGVDVDHRRQAGHVDKRRPGRELLAAHRVAPAAQADRLASPARAPNDLLQLGGALRPQNTRNLRGVQPRVHIVDDRRRVSDPGARRGKR